MKWTRILARLALVLAAPIVLAIVWVALFGWNWLRGPIEHIVSQKTGRSLHIQGDLSLHLGWPWPQIQAKAVRFANPAWAQQPYMVSSEAVLLSVDLPALFSGSVVLPKVHLLRPTVFLEQDGKGKKNWLLDMNQQDEQARVRIGQLTLDQGTLGYDDPAAMTHIRSGISSIDLPTVHPANPPSQGIDFHATGQFKGLALQAKGTGGPVLALRDESTPYPLQIDLTAGRTRIQARGSVTGLAQLSAVDMRLDISGDSLEQLYPLLGIPAPVTHAYRMQGHLLHSGPSWRFAAITGHIGASDISGTTEVTLGGKRPALKADLGSNLLDLDDLAPVIGKRAPPQRTATAQAPSLVLPDVPFKTDRWASMDADVQLRANQIRGAKWLPLDRLAVHATLRDAVLTLSPLDFGVAGGQLRAELMLDGRKDPIHAQLQLKVNKLLLSRLFPAAALNEQASIGEINGAFQLTGNGNSIQRMLASARGDMALLVNHGEVSQLLMERAGLHLWEILRLKVAGDKRIVLRCAVADFDVRNGVMTAKTLTIDTAVTTLLGSGTIDLGLERLDITFNQKTKNTSPLALRSPIYIHGSFSHPSVAVDKGRVALRAAGSVALGLVNPVLALIPLVDPGPGRDSDCAQLLSNAKVISHH